MQLQSGSLALSGAVTAAVLYAACSLFVLLAPELAVKLTGNVMHMITLEPIAANIQITLASFISGLVQVVLSTYVALLIFAGVYNQMTK